MRSRHTNGTSSSDLIRQAMAVLLNNQAAFVAQLNESNKARLKMDLENSKARLEMELESRKFRAEAEARFTRIEQRLEHIEAVLQRHELLLMDLPDAVSRKIGFRPK